MSFTHICVIIDENPAKIMASSHFWRELYNNLLDYLLFPLKSNNNMLWIQPGFFSSVTHILVVGEKEDSSLKPISINGLDYWRNKIHWITNFIFFTDAKNMAWYHMAYESGYQRMSYNLTMERISTRKEIGVCCGIQFLIFITDSSYCRMIF